jgi:hypothetical protein
MREHPSDVLDYFTPKAELLKKNLMPALEQNCLDKHRAVQRTAIQLLKGGIPVLAAPLLHY